MGAPVVSGAVTSSMMVLSVITSLFALRLRNRLGLPGVLLLAFGIQIGLIAALAISNSMAVIALLFLRMVPDSLSRPFIMARIQPLLEDDSRATYLSVQSVAGRLILASTLYFVSQGASDSSQMPYAEIQTVLVWYVVAGVVCIAALALAARRVRIEPVPRT